MNLDGKNTKSYGNNHLITQTYPDETLEYEPGKEKALAACFIQTYSLLAGIRKFKDHGLEAALKEANQDRRFDPGRMPKCNGCTYVFGGEKKQRYQGQSSG